MMWPNGDVNAGWCSVLETELGGQTFLDMMDSSLMPISFGGTDSNLLNYQVGSASCFLLDGLLDRLLRLAGYRYLIKLIILIMIIIILLLLLLIITLVH